MEVPDKGKESAIWVVPSEQASHPARKGIPDFTLNKKGMKEFFDFTGGSILYCLSAVFVAYGIVNVMGPMLSMGEALKNALPCILTLHVYELALLGVLILIVSRKVVDDAVSVVILIALFLVGTSIALGSVSDTGISASVWLGLAGVAIALGKLFVMKRFARIPFGIISGLGLLVIIICNYLGPNIMARSIIVAQLQEPTRRELWWLIWLVILVGAGLVIIEAMKGRPREQSSQTGRAPFLQTSPMVYIFALIVIAASGAHQYAMAYTSGLQRVIGDYVPIVAAAALLLAEIRRLLGRRFGFIEAVILCIPLALTLLAIEQKSVLSGNEFGFGLLGYPPFILALTGLVIARLSLYHQRDLMLVISILYGLGVILTAGFSPEHPYDLNFHACVRTLVVILVVYGLIIRNPYVCISGIFILCADFSNWDVFSKFLKSCQVTQIGGLAGVYGLSSAAICLLFGKRFHKMFRVVGAICLAGFIFDYLPENIHWRYAITLVGIMLLVVILWFRTSDVLIISILWVPFLIRIYIAAKQFAYWRAVIVGFLLLGAGAIASLLKRRMRDRANHQEDG